MEQVEMDSIVDELEELNDIANDGSLEQNEELVEDIQDIKAESLDEDISDELEENSDDSVQNVEIEEESIDEVDEIEDILEDEEMLDNLDEDMFMPPPADKNHKVVEQLDDVTRDSEIKASQIVENLDGIDKLAIKIKEDIGFQKVVIDKNIELFDKLSSKFSDIDLFKQMYEENKEIGTKIDEIELELDEIATSVTNSVDIMQYQDIHRQKIERVINVMRALSRYMNSLFESDIKDEERVSSAKSLEGEESIADDELEALLEQFANK